MGGGVAQDLERLLVPVGEDGQAGVTGDRPAEVDELVVEPGDHGGLREAGADRLGDLERGRTRLHLAGRTVRQRDLDRGDHLGHPVRSCSR